MESWPVTQRPSPKYYRESAYKPQIIIDMTAGYQVSRPDATRLRWKFVVGWEFLPNDQYVLLYQFFDANQGTVFLFTHPVRETSHEVRFLDHNLPDAVPSGMTQSGMITWDVPGISLMEQ